MKTPTPMPGPTRTPTPRNDSAQRLNRLPIRIRRRIALAWATAGLQPYDPPGPASCFPTAVICALLWVVVIGVDQSDVRRVELGPDVRLGAQRVVPNRDIADYLVDVDKLQRAAGRERQMSLLNAPLADSDSDTDEETGSRTDE